MAAVDTTITTTTYISNVAAGTADGSSLANRKLFTGIGSLIVNADANLYLVHDSTGANWSLVLGNGEVAAKTFTCYGGLFSIDENGNAITPDNPSAIRLAIGGTTTYKCGLMLIYSRFNTIGNVDWGQDTANAATVSSATFAFRCGDNTYFYNNTFKNFFDTSGTVLFQGGIFESCTFYGANNGAGSVFAIAAGFGDVVLIDCTQTTTGTYIFNTYGTTFSNTMLIKIVGSFTQGDSGGTQMIFGFANSGLHVLFYRRAFLKATSDGTTALSGVSYGAYEATGGVDMPLSSGVTGADGLCYPESPTNYNRGIWALQKVETYIRTTAGAMTWGTPTSTATYGNYTFVHAKTGYTPIFTTHYFTDGFDYGSAATPTALTLVATSPRVTAMTAQLSMEG